MVAEGAESFLSDSSGLRFQSAVPILRSLQTILEPLAKAIK